MIHQPASISPTAQIGAEVTVWRFTTICDGARIGAGSVIGSGVFIGKECVIGSGVHIQHGAFLPNGTVVEDGAFIGPLVVLTDDRLPRAGQAYLPAPPKVRQGASIGAGAVILPGVVIGAGAMVAAGALVTRDVPAGALAIGRGQSARAEAARSARVG